MDAQSTPPPREPDDHTGLAWRDDAWLAAWPLTRATALDYLACSPFYDRNCNNERAKAQGLGPDDLACVDSGFGRWWGGGGVVIAPAGVAAAHADTACTHRPVASCRRAWSMSW